ncbi:hypothetical protein COT50_03805, partial [candidate division WWE3 bacterium CG08_land_8_20_14_0_20_41_10]
MREPLKEVRNEVGQAEVLTGRYQGKFSGMRKEAEEFESPRGRTQRKSKILANLEVKTASPGMRAIRCNLEGKLTTQVKRKLGDVGLYLKDKLKQ